MKNFKIILFRILSALVIYFLVIYSFGNNFEFKKGSICFGDKLYSITEGLYMIIRNYSTLRKVLQIILFSYLDFLIVYVTYTWVLYGKRWRPLMTLCLFFIFREICTNIFEIKPSEDFIWNYPGIPSFTMSYHNNNSFFFSGSVGLYLICILELKSAGYNFLWKSSAFFMIIHSVLLITLRAQYTMCIFCGIVSAHYLHIISDKYCEVLNEFYDFNPEETEKLNQARRDKQIREIIEMSVKKYKNENSDKNKRYHQLENEIELEVRVEEKEVEIH
jgi:hypothetical protein